MRRPLGIHFSGHGIRNNEESVGDYHFQHATEGDFLLFETIEGDSQLVSRDELKRLILATKTNLDFVFLANCHSEFVGNIFREAGARHVICINHENEVADEAVLSFTEAFYDAVFANMKICDAFRQAKEAVSISISAQQASIFKCLSAKSDEKGHVCESFGKFHTGMYKEIFDTEPKFRLGSIDQAELVGR
jgi:hypothetical protein